MSPPLDRCCPRTLPSSNNLPVSRPSRTFRPGCTHLHFNDVVASSIHPIVDGRRLDFWCGSILPAAKRTKEDTTRAIGRSVHSNKHAQTALNTLRCSGYSDMCYLLQSASCISLENNAPKPGIRSGSIFRTAHTSNLDKKYDDISKACLDPWYTHT